MGCAPELRAGLIHCLANQDYGLSGLELYLLSQDQ